MTMQLTRVKRDDKGNAIRPAIPPAAAVPVPTNVVTFDPSIPNTATPKLLFTNPDPALPTGYYAFMYSSRIQPDGILEDDPVELFQQLVRRLSFNLAVDSNPIYADLTARLLAKGCRKVLDPAWGYTFSVRGDIGRLFMLVCPPPVAVYQPPSHVVLNAVWRLKATPPGAGVSISSISLGATAELTTLNVIDIATRVESNLTVASLVASYAFAGRYMPLGKAALDGPRE